MFASAGRRNAARQAAENARSQAADSFLALDELLRSVRMVVEGYAGLDAGPSGRTALRELAPVADRADAASSSWIDVSDQYAGPMDDPAADLAILHQAQDAFTRVGAALAEAIQALQAFQRSHAELERRVEAGWSQVAPRIAAAEQALAAARRAVAETSALGIRSESLQAALQHAEATAVPVAEGPHKHGLSATLRACAEASAAAEATVLAADRLRSLAAKGPSRMTSTATRLDGVASRLEHVPETLSQLRRDFSSRCSADLDDVPQRAGTALADARRLLAVARARSGEGRWEEADAALTAARDKGAVADRAVSSVTDRARDLTALAADPDAAKQRTRFAVRDAQRLVVSAGARAPANESRILDSLAARLDRVEEILGDGAHPDYWAYLTELRAIDEVAASVVRRTRAAIAGPG